LLEKNHYPFSRCPYCDQLLSIFDQDSLFCDNHGKVFEKDSLEKIYAVNFDMKDLLDDKDWLDYMYSYSYHNKNNSFIKRRGFSVKRIAIALGVNEKKVVEKLKMHQIPLRGEKIDKKKDKELYEDKNWIYEEFHSKGKTIPQISQEHGVSENWVRDRLNKMDIAIKIKPMQPIGLKNLFERLLGFCEGNKEYFICRGLLEEKGFLQDEIKFIETFLGALSLKDRLIRRKKGKIIGNWIGFFEVEEWSHTKKMEFCPDTCIHKSKGDCRRLVGIIINAGILEQVIAFIDNFTLSDGRSEIAQLNRGFIKFKELNKKEAMKFAEGMERLKKKKKLRIGELEHKINVLKDNIQQLHNLKSETNDALGFTKQYFYEMFVDVKWGDKPAVTWTNSFKENSELYKDAIIKIRKKKRLKFTFYASLEWADVRNEILKRDKFTCQNCGHKPSRQVHHLSVAIFYPERCLDPENLIVLCDKCHDDWKKGGK